MNFLQLAQRLHRELARSGDGPTAFATDTMPNIELWDWINDAWVNLQGEPRAWRWMRRKLDQPLVIGQASYGATALAGDFGRWRKADDDDEYTVRVYEPTDPTQVHRLDFLPLDEFRKRFEDVPPDDARPRFWSIGDDDSLLIAPAPDVAYNVRADYVIAPAALTTDTDVPSMPAKHHMLLVWKALADAGQFDAAPDVVQRAFLNHRAMRFALENDQMDEIVWPMQPLL